MTRHSLFPLLAGLVLLWTPAAFAQGDSEPESEDEPGAP